MSNSTTTIDQISVSQSQKEVTANALFDAFSPAVNFGRRASTCSGLTWGYYGATISVSGVPTQIANGTIALTNAATNYLYATSAGTVTKVTSAPTGWPGPITSPAGAIALYEIVTAGSLVTSYTDYRLSASSASGGFLVAGDIANTKIATITFVINGGGTVITTGIKGDLEIPFACTINRSTLLADQSGSIVVDIWKDTYANYPPVVGDSITASAKPTISSATKAQDSTLTGWTTSITAGDTLRFNVDSITTCTSVTVSLKVTKT